MESNVLQKLEMELTQLEKAANPVATVWNKIMLENGFEETSAWYQFGDMCAKHPWFNEVENEYHNAVHTAQVMWCGNFLAPKKMLEQDKRWFPKFILALMFHDLGHTGKHNTFKYELELLACDRFDIFLNANKKFKMLWDHYLEHENGDWKEMIEFVKRLIIGTEVTVDVPKNIEDYESTSEHTLLQVLLVLMQEADVLPSALPNVGKVNSEKLALEWNNPNVSSQQGRLSFLKMIKYVSKSAKSLGIPEMINIQIKELEM